MDTLDRASIRSLDDARIAATDNNSKTGAKGKVTKNKSSQKQKTKNKQQVKVVVQAPQAAPARNVTEELTRATKAMLMPDPDDIWVEPRPFPTECCPTNYVRSIQVDSDSGVILDATPDLDYTLKIHSKPKTSVPRNLSAGLDLNAYFIARNGVRFYPELLWRDAGGLSIPVPSFMVDDPNGIVLRAKGVESSSYDIEPILGKRLIYAASAIGGWGNTNAGLTFTGGAVTTLNQRIRTLDENLNVVEQDTQDTANPVSGTQYTNVVGIAASTPFFDFSIQLTVPAVVVTITSLSLGIATTNMDIKTVSTTTYGPSPDIAGSLFQAVKNSSSKYSFPMLSLLATYVGSDLLNGGNIAIGVVPHNYPLSLVPQVAYDQICALGGHRYSGPMKNGAHGFYIPDDITRVAFYPIGTRIEGRRLVVAILPQVVAVGQSSAVTFRIELRSHIEWINPSQTLTHMTAKCSSSELVEAMFCALESGDQVGENPDHMKRLASMVKRVAQDPKTRQYASQALSWLGKGAAVAAPLLLM